MAVTGGSFAPQGHPILQSVANFTPRKLRPNKAVSTLAVERLQRGLGERMNKKACLPVVAVILEKKSWFSAARDADHPQVWLVHVDRSDAPVWARVVLHTCQLCVCNLDMLVSWLIFSGEKHPHSFILCISKLIALTTG